MKSTFILFPVLALVLSSCSRCSPVLPANPDADGTHTLYLFSQEAGLGEWDIQDDVVMGGRSQSYVSLNDAGNLLFTGDVSLENNRGFSSVQAEFDPIDVSPYRSICIGLHGDGKDYQLRIKSEPDANHSYATDFTTCGKWEVIEIPFSDMYASHHGDRLDRPNYPGQQLAHIQILIGNQKTESFQLELDRIWLK